MAHRVGRFGRRGPAIESRERHRRSENAIENIYEDVNVRAHHRAKGSSVSRGIRDRYIRSESLLRLTGFD